MKNSNQSIKKQCTCGALKGTQFHSGNCALAVPPKSHRMSCDCGHPGIGYINMPQSERECKCGCWNCPHDYNLDHDCSPKLKQPQETEMWNGNKFSFEGTIDQPIEEWQDRLYNKADLGGDLPISFVIPFISQTLLLEKQRSRKEGFQEYMVYAERLVDSERQRIKNRLQEFSKEQNKTFDSSRPNDYARGFNDFKEFVLKLLEDKDE